MHDGPEYARVLAADAVPRRDERGGRIPPLWAALLPPVDRNETYSASAVYAAALSRELLPELAGARRTGRASAWGRASARSPCCMPTSATRAPSTALLLQSGSFFRQRFDKVESSFGRYARITRFVGTVLRGAGDERTIPVMVTCGTAEENLANNRARRRGARTAGAIPCRFAEVRDAHNWVCWRDALDPHLVDLLEAVS